MDSGPDSNHQGLEATEAGGNPVGGGAHSLAPTALASIPGPPPMSRPSRLLTGVMLGTAVVVTGALLIVFAARKRAPRELGSIGEAVASLTAPLLPALAPALAQAVPGARGTAPSATAGRDLAAVAWASDAVEPQVAACFAGWVRPVPVNVIITLTPSGSVTDVVLQEPDNADSSVKDCVARAYRSMTPASFGGELATFVKAFLVR